jgi:acetyltransferase
MAIRKLDQIFNPKRIAVVGVSPNPQTVGAKLLTNLVGGGFAGVVYPVNPTSEAVLGIQCYPDVKSLPKIPDLGVICAPAGQVPDLVRQCGEAGILGLVIASAGFRESGPEGKALEDAVAAEIERFDGMRIIGPNCLGFIVPRLKLNVSFARGMPRDGHIAFVSQSGALCSSVLDWALEEKIGFSYFVSIGNTLDVDFGDLIDFFGEDDRTKSIILYIESIGDARKFMTAARAFARTKPIVAYKAGRFPESAAVAASHTGAMAAEDDVYDAAFQRAGIARVLDIGEIFDCADLIGRKKTSRGPRLGIVTNAGGPGVMATDALIAEGGRLAELSAETLAKLNDYLPPFWSHRNPVDVLGDARAKRVSRATEILIDDPGIDAVLVIITPQAMTNPAAIAKAIVKVSETTDKPILAAWLGGQSMREGIGILNEAGIATYTTPEQAVRAFMTLVSYSRNLRSLYETPKDIPVEFTLDRKEIRERFDSLVSGQGSVLSEEISKTLLEAYGIPVSRPRLAKTAGEAARIARETGYPVVLKIVSPDITHKTDVGGVAVDVEDEESLHAAYDRMLTAVGSAVPDAEIAGVSIQPMIKATHAVELILGTKKDPIFGTVIMAGLGGTAAELYKDRALGFPPLNERLARRMLESLKIWPLLEGYRGRPAADIDRVIEILMRLSYLVADYPEIVELDVNPLLAGPKTVVALDARVALDPELLGREIRPYSHLALRPYPEEYVRPAKLRDGRDITLRPIKPEDEPMWFELLRSCSRESLYQRFRYFFHWETHEVASRYCFIDYDREIAIVPELEEGGVRKLLGVGRLVADPDHQAVEYAILVGDAWQNMGLGGLLTEYCIEIARHWDLDRIVAQTATDNLRMLAILKRYGFETVSDPCDSTVEVIKQLKV